MVNGLSDQGLVLSDNVPTLKLDQTNYVIGLCVTEGKATRNSYSCFDSMFPSVLGESLVGSKKSYVQSLTIPNPTNK